MSSSRRQIYFNQAAAEETCSFPQVEGLTQFHQSLTGYAPTPLTPLPDLAAELGVRAVLVKDESNRLGLPSFKVLGASWGCYRAIAAYLGLPSTVSLEEMSTRAKERSVRLFAATKGNHGRAVAFMARTLDVDSQIFVSESMDLPTQNRITQEGARVTTINGDYDQAVLEALKVSGETDGGLLIQDTALDGYEEVPAWIVEGYSTMMAEIAHQLTEMSLHATVMVTPVGVGSLANTVATYCKSRESSISVVAVEPDTAACLQDSLLAGKLTPIETSSTIMDGMNCGTVSTTAWPNLQRFVDSSITVSCHESHLAVEYLTSHSISAGPCGAASLAALRRLATVNSPKSPLNKDSVVVLLSTEGPRDYPIPLDVSVNDTVELTSTLTKINSSNLTLSVAHGVGETQICDYLAAWFAHRGLEYHRIEPIPGRPSIVGVLRGTGGGSSLMFNGHVDTVSLASYDKDPLSGTVDTRNDQQVVLGRGSLDMKGGLASALVAVSTAKASCSPLRGDVIVAAVADEEDASQGTRDLLAAGWREDAAVIPEPTTGVIAHAHKGFVWVEVDVLGVAAHGSNHIEGVDAILHAGWFLRALEQYQQRLPVDDVLGPATLHCGLIQGGEEASSYPAKCTVTVEFRTIPGQTDESIVGDIRIMLEDIQRQNSKFRFTEPQATLSRPAHKIDSSHPLIGKVADCASAVTGARPLVQSVSFWCDAALLSEAGIPSVVFGPSGHGLHGKEEWVEVKSLQHLQGTFTKLIQEFCTHRYLLDDTTDMEDQPLSGHPYINPLQGLDLDDDRGVNAAPASSWPVEEDIFFDWDALYGPQGTNIGIPQGDRISWSTFDSLDFNELFPTPLLGGEPALDEPHIPFPSQSTNSILPSGFNNVAEWLDGAYHPAMPCDHCRRHRLQCLILRRTTDNPNPVPACSSCVGLFRPCSFGRGEKRQASRFETLSPVLGHLHGVIEEESEGACNDTKDSTDPKETKQFVRKGARVLRDWFYRNEDYPYPCEQEKARLAQETGFSRQRISTWFANARRRRKQQRQVGSSTRIFRAGSPMPTSDAELMTPMERWQASPPDDEPVPEAAIREAIASASVGPGLPAHRSQVDSPSTDFSSALEDSSLASSLSSLGAPTEASDSSSSAWSYHSGEGPLRSRPYHSRPSVGRRGGRKRVAEDGRYQCTFCMQTFKKKHDWSRHEKSVHLSLDVWICTPNLSELEPAHTRSLACRCCDHQSLDQEHWESHDFRECATKPLSERSFSRKDYLWQHLRKFHGCTQYPVPDLNAWRSLQNEIHSRCGFCASLLPSWSARADHLATHFKEGCRMSQWVGDWGFDSSVQASLRNAVLPIQRGLMSIAST
ncbi:hypothetical protein BDW59DRAFT_163469 [Aspergillus cavernicola]|uniref:Uncharacterized protein n=1 Tax=Aspergillus cavernicola TaxID=176166 RepID=A0ABR4I6C6_9EURO